MRILSLEHLVGPGTSRAENFEILILELYTTWRGSGPDKWFRIKAPDRGIDLFNRTARVTTQCKCYPSFTHALVQSVTKSVNQALKARSDFNWDHYELVIPFLPTATQRVHLEGALSPAGPRSRIHDADDIERMLCAVPDVANRFFPQITLVLTSSGGPLRLLVGPTTPITLVLVSARTGQTIEALVSPEIKCRVLLEFLIGALKLPDKVLISPLGRQSTLGGIKWGLARLSAPDVWLDQEKTIAELQLFDRERLGLPWGFQIMEQHGMAMRDEPLLWDWSIAGDITLSSAWLFFEEVVELKYKGTLPDAVSQLVAHQLSEINK
jgi:hypothetical protein